MLPFLHGVLSTKYYWKRFHSYKLVGPIQEQKRITVEASSALREAIQYMYWCVLYVSKFKEVRKVMMTKLCLDRKIGQPFGRHTVAHFRVSFYQATYFSNVVTTSLCMSLLKRCISIRDVQKSRQRQDQTLL